jgi:hypothetical protein
MKINWNISGHFPKCPDLSQDVHIKSLASLSLSLQNAVGGSRQGSMPSRKHGSSAYEQRLNGRLQSSVRGPAHWSLEKAQVHPIDREATDCHRVKSRREGRHEEREAASLRLAHRADQCVLRLAYVELGLHPVGARTYGASGHQPGCLYP